MLMFSSQASVAAQFHQALSDGAGIAPRLIDLLATMAGGVVEVCFLFDAPDEALVTILCRLADDMGTNAEEGLLPPACLPPAHMIDAYTEEGRLAARLAVQEAEEDQSEYVFRETVCATLAHMMTAWEGQGLMSRAQSLRLLMELSRRAMAYEIAAQELCDVVIERKLAPHIWSAGGCITALAAAAGRRQALALGGAYVHGARLARVVSCGLPMPEALDAIAHVMTREAVRGGVEAGSDWRFGLAANDIPLNAPLDFIRGIEPWCQSFFRAIALPSWRDQAVACAKAAGRMLAVAAGGSLPDIEPEIAKPLAMAAMTETYKYTSRTQASVSG